MANSRNAGQESLVKLKKDLVPTGIRGLDKILRGGIPKGRIVLITGNPGSGKTTFCAEFLLKGIEYYGENGLFVSLEEPVVQLIREINNFGYDVEKYLDEDRLAIIDASPISLPKFRKGLYFTGLEKGKPLLPVLLNLIQEVSRKIEVKRIAVDPLTSLLAHYTATHERRSALLDLMEGLTKTGATCLITSELHETGPDRRIGVEEFVAHGVILLRSYNLRGKFYRSLQVTKMREIDHDEMARPYRITNRGIVVYHNKMISY